MEQQLPELVSECAVGGAVDAVIPSHCCDRKPKSGMAQNTSLICVLPRRKVLQMYGSLLTDRLTADAAVYLGRTGAGI